MNEFRPTRLEALPGVIKNLLIINVIVFLAQQVFENAAFSMTNVFALHTLQSELFQPWQLITHMFMHGDLGHLFFNMFALWMFGSILENMWGSKRFLTFYLLSGLGAALCHMTVLYHENQQLIQDFALSRASGYSEQIVIAYTMHLNEATLGASGAVFGCLAAFGYLFPNTYIYIYFFLPLKAKWFVFLYAGAELYMAVKTSAGDNVAHVAHLGGALVGFLIVYYWNRTNRKRFY